MVPSLSWTTMVTRWIQRLSPATPCTSTPPNDCWNRSTGVIWLGCAGTEGGSGGKYQPGFALDAAAI